MLYAIDVLLYNRIYAEKILRDNWNVYEQLLIVDISMLKLLIRGDILYRVWALSAWISNRMCCAMLVRHGSDSDWKCSACIEIIENTWNIKYVITISIGYSKHLI